MGTVRKSILSKLQEVKLQMVKSLKPWTLGQAPLHRAARDGTARLSVLSVRRTKLCYAVPLKRAMWLWGQLYSDFAGRSCSGGPQAMNCCTMELCINRYEQILQLPGDDRDTCEQTPVHIACFFGRVSLAFSCTSAGSAVHPSNQYPISNRPTCTILYSWKQGPLGILKLDLVDVYFLMFSINCSVMSNMSFWFWKISSLQCRNLEACRVSQRIFWWIARKRSSQSSWQRGQMQQPWRVLCDHWIILAVWIVSMGHQWKIIENYRNLEKIIEN